MDINIKEEENGDFWTGLDDDNAFSDDRPSSSGKRGASRGSENGKKKMKLEENEVKSLCIPKSTKRNKSEFKLCEEIRNILDPVTDQLLELPLNLEKFNQIVQWAENIKIKFILKKVQAAADEIVENT